MNKKIAIIGHGYVGKAMVKFFKDHYDVFIYDPNEENSHTQEDINKCDLGVICVPTPMSDDGSCDTSIVEEVVSWLKTPLAILKSTVPVGITDELISKYGLRMVFAPEYCGESTYWSPYSFHTEVKDTPFFTFGGDSKDCSEAIDYYLPITGPMKTYHQTTAKTAEMAKYMENCFYATKIAFCNEVYSICEGMGIDWNAAREAWLLDPRIHPMHTAVFKDNRGFGGKCLPKDLNAMVSFALQGGVNPILLKSVWESNMEVRKDGL